MTPRAVMKIASEEKSIADFFKDNQKLRFSRNSCVHRNNG